MIVHQQWAKCVTLSQLYQTTISGSGLVIKVTLEWYRSLNGNWHVSAISVNQHENIKKKVQGGGGGGETSADSCLSNEKNILQREMC